MKRSLVSRIPKIAQRVVENIFSTTVEVSFVNTKVSSDVITFEIDGMMNRMAKRWSPDNNEYVIDVNASLTLIEKTLRANGLKIRNRKGLIDPSVLNIQVKAEDANGDLTTYNVLTIQPDETIGSVIFALGFAEQEVVEVETVIESE